MIGFVRERFVQNIVSIVQYFRKEVVIHVSDQLRRRGVIGFVEPEPDTCGLPFPRHLAAAPWTGKIPVSPRFTNCRLGNSLPSIYS